MRYAIGKNVTNLMEIEQIKCFQALEFHISYGYCNSFSMS